MFLDNPSIHLDLETGFEEIFIGTKYTTDTDVEITLPQTINHLQHCKETWDEAPHLLRFENPLCYLTMENFE